MPTKLSIAIILLFSLALAAGAFGQGESSPPPSVNPYRPTVTDPASLTVPGYLEMEIGGQDAHGGEGTHRRFSTPAVLKLTDKSARLEYHVSLDGDVFARAQDGTSAQGFGNVTPGLQYLLVAQTPRTYDLAARLEYTVPTNTNGVASGKSGYDLLLLASKDYTPRVHADYNLAEYLLGRASGSGFATQYQASAAFSFKLTPEISLQDELYGFSGSSEGGTIVSTLHAIGYQPFPYLAFDAGVDVGLSHAAPRYTILFGSTFFLGKLF